MSDLVYDDDLIRGILKGTRTIAMAGASPNWVRPSNFAMKYLLGKGYKVHPINPGHAGKEIWGRMTYGSLADIPAPIDMLDIFRNSEAAGQLVEEAIALKDEKGIKTIWMQLGVINKEAAKRAEDAGLTVIMDRCPKIEYGRLFGELSWSGVNSGIITSKRRKAPA
ncbi:MAG: CoA-binding protein [Rhodospirillales bacterium]|nr:CoA-binding protein [Rhodospirillales bacterium]MBO6786975.1 CoA-binding protein [Rhodospirillales bacterium]